MDLVSALKRPFSDWKKLGIGVLVTVVPILNIALQGYSFRCATKKSTDLPDWKGIGSLWIQGLLALVISIILSIPLLIVLGLGYSSALVGILTDPTTATSLFSDSIWTMLIAIIIGGLTAYIVPVALLEFATGTFSDAFAFGRIFKKAFSKTWLIGWILAIVAVMIIATIGMLLGTLLTITIIGPLIMQILSTFAASIAGWTLLGDAYSSK